MWHIVQGSFHLSGQRHHFNQFIGKNDFSGLKIHQSLISKYAICRMSGSGVIYPHDIRNNIMLCVASSNSILMLLQLSGSIL